MNSRRIANQLANTDAGRLLLAVDRLGGEARSDQAEEATGFTSNQVRQLTRQLNRFKLVLLDQQSLAEDVDLTPLGREVAEHLR